MALDPPDDIVTTASRRPPSTLLAQQVYVVASRNETTAAAKSRCDRTVEATFWMADPPAVSFCSFHCSNPPISNSDDADLDVQPHVIAAEGRFVLLCTRFASGDGEYEYFMYKGDVKSPSLECIPLPEDGMLDGVNDFGILPLGDAYLLVGFYDDIFTLDYDLRIYSSVEKRWRTERLLNPYPRGDMIIPEKVIALGEGVLGIVDFWQGMLVVNLLQKPLVARYIPLPNPLPENVRKLQVYNPGASPGRFRDLTCSNGVIKFIEMEHRVITAEIRDIALEKPEDPSQKGVLYDSELIRLQKPVGVESKPRTVYTVNGWRAVTWMRAIESDRWLIGCSVDVDDILVDNTFAEMLSSQSVNSLGNYSFKNMYSAWPVLSPDGDDILYLKTSPKFRGLDTWAVAVNLAEKKLKVEACGVEARSLGRYIPSWQMYQPCALSKHLNMTPGIKVQAFCEIKLAGTSVNDRNATAVHAAEPNSCETINKRPRLSAEKVSLAQHGAHSVMQNAHMSSLSEADSCETENERQRLSAEKVNLTQNGAHSVVQNGHILCPAEPVSCETETNHPRLSAEKFKLAQNGASSVLQNAHLSARPYQNSQVCWIPHNAPFQPPEMYFSGSWRPFSSYHKNNLHVSFQPPQQGFNRWGGSSVPWYAPSAPATNLSYGKYHSEWWQPLLSMQQPSPIRAFGPPEAPHPCFNNWYGASNHGYSQLQLPAHNLNAYGSRSDNGNYQVQSQQRPSVQVLPAYAALQQQQLTASGVWISRGKYIGEGLFK